MKNEAKAERKDSAMAFFKKLGKRVIQEFSS